MDFNLLGTKIHEHLERLLNKAPGLTKRGERIPDTVDEWRYLAQIYGDKIIEDRETIRNLIIKVNTLEQKLAACRRKKQ